MKPAGRLGARGLLYRLLVEAGPDGVDQREITERHRIGDVGVQVASLRAEGHGIMELHGVDEHGRSSCRIYLRHDAWADLPVAVESA